MNWEGIIYTKETRPVPKDPATYTGLLKDCKFVDFLVVSRVSLDEPYNPLYERIVELPNELIVRRKRVRMGKKGSWLEGKIPIRDVHLQGRLRGLNVQDLFDPKSVVGPYSIPENPEYALSFNDGDELIAFSQPGNPRGVTMYIGEFEYNPGTGMYAHNTSNGSPFGGSMGNISRNVMEATIAEYDDIVGFKPLEVKEVRRFLDYHRIPVEKIPDFGIIVKSLK